MIANDSKTKKVFKLEFSNRVIEHLGVKLYQNKPTNVISEFLSNCWDADAETVDIDLKAASSNGHPNIVIIDDGRGMTRDELTDNFLVIGLNRRTKPKEKTLGGRLPMGRKGIGKLAGFGIAKTIDILSTPNLKLREDLTAKDQLFYWLRFSLDAIDEVTNISGAGAYKPTVVADGIGLNAFKQLVDNDDAGTSYEQFIKNAESGKGGVVVRLSDTTLKKTINPDDLLRSLGRRFTVAMLRPDFVVKINAKQITPQDALPPLQDFKYGDWNMPIEETVTFGGEKRTMRYWVRFVSLKDEEWPIENAGVGVYAHGKIAQDRPFFFGVKGKEIFSRYLYCVVEADWLDELPEDVISTDRRSVNWEIDATSELHKWGEGKVSIWVEGFRKWRLEQPKKLIVERIRKVTPAQGLSGKEEDALAGLLSEVLPSFGNDEEAKDRTTERFTAAWAHTPTRELTKALWKKVFEPSDVGHDVFPAIIEQLRQSMVPESMGLAVTMAQRIAAITAMRRLIESDSTETSLQRLIESFPWLLGPSWERLTANQTIKTLVTTKHRPDTASGQWTLPPEDGALKPDFVFLSDTGAENEIVVFELKGPECGKTLQTIEYQQLSEYLQIIRGVYPDRTTTVVRGVLVGHDKGGFEEHDKRIEIRTWSEVLLEARRLHVSYLAALLRASEPNANDMRIKQIADFGGKETLELVSRLANIGEYLPFIAEMFPEKTP